MVIEGTRTDDGNQCTLVAVHERTGGLALYPHGDTKLGVRLARAEALKMAQAILDDAGAGPPTQSLRRGCARLGLPG
ncbi:MAG: hypothetical protein ACT4NY_33450 [Pseudonocardiales bacterium]